MTKILFICHGNICRSPMAEFYMKDLVKREGLEDRFEIASAAMHNDEIGNPVYPQTRAKLAEHGISCAGKTARRATKSDYQEYDYLIGMDKYNINDMMRLYDNDPEDKISLLLDHADRVGESVADPWYTRNFDLTWDDVAAGCNGLIEELRREGKC